MAAARKVVTVLFADMTGSTSLEEQLDAERVRALVDRFYSALRAEVEKRGGRVVKFTGDGLMAAFGVPEVHEDDALRAIEAATAMCSVCAELATQIGFPSVSLKVGINTGEVVVIEDDDDVVGDSVNVASRLEGAAGPGEVLVGEETWRLTRSVARFRPIEALTLKGKSEPVPAYRLVSISDGVADTLAAPFIGREHELDLLLAAFDDAVASNGARLVTIVGSPGLGKTRLTREFAERVAGRAVVRETRCDPTSATFAPIAEALREANEIPESADEEEVLAALLDRIPEDEPEREKIATLAAAILGVGHPGSTEETFWALRRMIESVAARDLPRVMVLEDLHWAEPLLLDLVEHLAEWIREGPVLLIGTARPELRELRPSLVEGGRAHAVLALEGLDGDATERLAVGLLGTDEVPSDLLAKIPDSTEGNPLFVREFVRMLVDDGVLQRTSSGWEVSVDVDAIEVPPTIQSLLAARVDRLRSDERTLIELAAVIGKEFYRGALDALAPAALRGQVEAALESLRRKELVEPAGTYWIDEPVYRFHHVLIRDAAYRRLLKETRAEVHERMADWLEGKTAGVLGEHEELIGFHLEQAHEYKRQLGDADDSLGERAAALLGEAARRALDRDDLAAAASLSGRALTRLPDGGSARSALLIVRCEALLSMGDVSSGAVAVQDLEDLTDTPRLRAWAACFAGQLASLVAPERLQEVEKRVSAAASELAGLGDPSGAAKAHTVHGSTLARLGRFAECESALDAALTAAREANDRRRITAVLGSAPLAALWGPNPVSRAGGRCLDLVRLSRITTGSPGVEVTSTRCQAVLEAFRGRADAARRMLDGARRTLTELGLKHELLETEQFAGIVELVAGDAAAALPHLRRAHDGFRFVGVDVSAAQTAALLARAHLRLGELDAAESYANETEELGGQDLKASIAWRAVRAELLAQRGEFDEARRLAESAVDIASSTDALIDHGDACASLAVVCSAAGDAAGAQSASENAFALYERKGATALLEERLAAPDPLEPAAEPELVEANTAVQHALLIAELFERRDWDAMRSVLADDITLIDRRQVVGIDYVDSREKYIEQFKIVADVGTARIVSSIVATRGQHLALLRCGYVGADVGSAAFQVELLLLFEFDDKGRHTAGYLFDTDNVGEALIELDRRFASSGGASYADVIGLFGDIFGALNNRDWAKLRGLLSADFVLADHRPGSLGEMRGPEDWIASLQQLVALVPCRFELTAYHRLGGDCVALQARHVGVTDEGARIESAFHWAASVGGGQLRRIELYPLEQRRAALDRVEQLLSQTHPLDNECIGVLRAFLSAFEARDWDALAAYHREDFAMYDRRAGLGMTYRGRETQVEVLKGTADVGTTNAELTPIAVRGSRLSLVSTVWRGPTDSAFGSEFLAVSEIDEDGRIAEIVVFGVDDLDAATDELDDRYSAARAAEHATHPDLSNAATAFGDRHNTAFEARDWATYAAQLADDVLFEDRRKGFRVTWTGREAQMLATKAVAEVAARFRLENMAIRGELLALDRMTATGRGGPAELETEFLSVKEWDSSGRLVRMVNFDPDDLSGAFEELDERFVAGEGALRTDLVRVVGEILRAMNLRDWAGLRAFFADDLVFVDHRPTSLAESRGGDRRVAELRALLELLSSYHCRIVRFHRLQDSLVLGRLGIEGRTADGVDVEISYLILAELPKGVFTRMEIFPLDGFVDALARWDDLAGTSVGSARPGPHVESEHTRATDSGIGQARAMDVVAESRAALRDLTNLCTRGLARVVEAFEAAAWDVAAESLSPDSVFEDRRAALGVRSEGRPAVLEMLQTLSSVGAKSVDWTPIAVRGDRLMLGRTIFGGPHDAPGRFEAECLAVYEVDADGRLSLTILFDSDDLEAAHAELDARYAAGEAAPVASTWETIRRSQVAYNARDWDEMSRLLAPDVAVGDHRPTGSGEWSGRAEWISYIKGLLELTPDARTYIAAVHRLTPRGGVLGFDVHGTNAEGGSIEMPSFVVYEIHDDLMTRIEQFPVGRLGQALRRFDEIDPSQTLENDATRLARGFSERLDRGDWDALRPILSEDLVIEDRRRGVGSRGVGRAAWINNFTALRALDFRPDRSTTLAIRGDRLALSSDSMVDVNGNIIEVITVAELDEASRCRALIFFDPSDMDAALEELEARYIAGEGAPFAGVLERSRAQRGALRRGDWDAYRSLVAEGVVLVDHRPASLGQVHGREAVIEALQTFIPLISNVRPIVRQVFAIASDRLLVQASATGASEHGGDVEVSHIRLQQWGPDGVVRIELFPDDQLKDARRRFEELGGQPDSGEGLSRPTRLENACSSAGDRMVAAFAKRDWGAVEDCFSVDAINDERRRGLRHVLDGRAEIVAGLRQLADLGAAGLENVVLATRGDRMALSSRRLLAVEGLEVEAEILVVEGSDDEGRIRLGILFDPDDLDAAFAELDVLYASGEGKSYAEQIDFGNRVFAAINERDWEAYRSLLNDDLVLVDHRPASLGEMVGGDEQVEAVRSLVDVIPTVRFRVTRVHALESNACVVEVWAQGNTADGDDLDLSFLALYGFDGLLSRIELFATGEVEAALARLEELNPGNADHETLENTATRLAERNCADYEARDWGALEDGLAEDIVQEDRREGVRGVIREKTTVGQQFRIVAELGMDRMSMEPLEIRGDRLALLRGLLEGSDQASSFRVDYLVLIEADDDARTKRIVLFDPSDLAAAAEELEESFLSGEGAAHARLWRPIARLLSAYNTRDWSGARATLADDARLTDNRPAYFGTLGPDEWVASFRVSIELTPDLMYLIPRIHLTGDDVVVYETNAFGSTVEGAEIELRFLNIAGVREGKIAAYEWFPVGELAAALARARELAEGQT